MLVEECLLSLMYTRRCTRFGLKFEINKKLQISISSYKSIKNQQHPRSQTHHLSALLQQRNGGDETGQENYQKRSSGCSRDEVIREVNYKVCVVNILVCQESICCEPHKSVQFVRNFYSVGSGFESRPLKFIFTKETGSAQCFLNNFLKFFLCCKKLI